MVENALFYVFAAFTLVSGLLVVVNRKPVNAAMAMIMTIIGVAANMFLLGAPFLATLLIMVYAGAVIVLFLFVIMLVEPDLKPLKRGWVKTALGGLIFFAICAVCVIWLFDCSGAIPVADVSEQAGSFPYSADAKVFGSLLFSKYAFLVEAVALLLLASMAAVFMLHERRKAPLPEQSPAK
ncbi:MAG: NADH-quinone oxidoreductase subunit J [Opitutae bacterium]|nr:NADH-quinone oxidoreductase subunit J [Opitutae bacterium]MCD8298542.1 NADH-quinone oxidoreductase subunit J [Opitutae bacterium]